MKHIAITDKCIHIIKYLFANNQFCAYEWVLWMFER